MATFNKTLLMGNLTRDVELKFLPSGDPVASFGIAVNRRYKSGDDWKDEVCYVDITVWGKQGENCAEPPPACCVSGRHPFPTNACAGARR